MNDLQFQAILLRNIQEAVIATDVDGKITFWNEGAENVYGYSADEIIGKTPATLYPDHDQEQLARDLEQIDDGVDFVGEWTGRHKDGSIIWVDVTTSILRDTSGEVIGYVGISRDVTERKGLEQQVATLFSREQEAHRQLRQFLSLVAHDLRQPLTIIRSSAQMLQRKLGRSDDSGVRSYIRMLDSASARLQRFTDDVQDAGRIGASQFNVNRIEMNLPEVLRLVIAEQQQMSNHQIVLDSPDEIPGEWDRDRMIQLFSNLVTNACTYSPDGGRVEISASQVANEVVVQVSDEGPGIEPDQQELLFQAFTRFHKESNGSGLGLYICRGIVEAHGGRIWVQSEPGKGSQFCVSLPAS